MTTLITSNKVAANSRAIILSELACILFQTSEAGFQLAGPLKCKSGVNSNAQAKQEHFKTISLQSRMTLVYSDMSLFSLDLSHQAIQSVLSQSLVLRGHLYWQLAAEQAVVPIISVCSRLSSESPKPDAEINVGLLFQLFLDI